MQFSTSAIICSVRTHGETGAIVRAFAAEEGMLAGYVQAEDGRLSSAPGSLSGVIGAAPQF